MAEDRGLRPPVVCRVAMRLAGWIVPRHTRSEWQHKWDSGLLDWWILVERGELPADASTEFIGYTRAAFVDALRLRFSKVRLHRWSQGPAFVAASAALVLLLVAILTNGFTMTRALIAMARAMHHPQGQTIPWNAPENTLMAYLFPIAFALATGLMLVAIGRLSVGRYGWWYWSFLAFKTICVMVLAPLLWIEGGAAIRAHISNSSVRILAGGLGLAMLFIFGFGCALLWCFADQRQRCPVCLRRLAMPVTIGSWASVFEPLTCEFLCAEGHGLLCVSETEMGGPDRWTALDASWRP